MTRTTSTTTGAGERVDAFVPLPLPPRPPLVIDGCLQTLLESAPVAVGRLDGVSTLLSANALFLNAYVRKEALVSSQIEGTQSSLSGLLLLELSVAREFTGRRRDRLFVYDRYVAILGEGTEVVAGT